MKISRNIRRVLRRQNPSLNSITCGTENPASIGCRFYELEGGETAAVFSIGEFHESHKGIMHGGLSAAVLDETMGRTIMHRDNCKADEPDFMCVTMEMTVRYRKPVLTGGLKRAYGRIEKEDGLCVHLTADIVDEADEILATARGKFVKIQKTSGAGEENEKNHQKYLPLTEKDPKDL